MAKPYSDDFRQKVIQAIELDGLKKCEASQLFNDVLVYLFDQVPKKASGPQHPFVNKVLDLGDNFPLCYYAGGSKFLPGETLTLETSPIPTGLTAGQRRRLRQKLDTLQAEWDIRSEKIKRLGKDLAIEAGTAVKFQLEQQLLDEEAKLAYLGNELDDIESVLQS